MLLVVGFLAFAGLASGDVKHVLDGSAHPPPCYHQAANPVPGSVDFWWADSNSPFKQAYEYFKKCSSKENCLPPIAPQPFAPQPQPFAPQPQPFAPQPQPFAPQPTPPEPLFNREHFEKNAFLNGQIQPGAYSTPPKPDLSQNPFLNKGMQAAYSSTGQAVTTGPDGFLGVQPSIPFAQCQCVNQNQCPEENKHPGQCNGVGQVCCRLGGSATFTASNAFASSSYSNLSHITSGKASSGSLIKFGGGAGLSPGSIQVVSDDAPIPNPLVNKAAPNPSNTIKVIRNTYNTKNVFASTIDYTNDNLGELSFDASFQGPQYLPPTDAPPRPSPTTASIEYLPPISTPSPPIHVPTDSNLNNQYVFPPQPNTSPKPSPGYQYSTPTPAFEYPKPSSPKPFTSQGSNINNQYVSTKPTPGYVYPQPTPAFNYPTPTPIKTPPKPFVTPNPLRTPTFLNPTPTPIKTPPKPFVTPFVPKPSVTPFVPQPSLTPFVPRPSVTPFVPSPSSYKPFVPSPTPSKPSVTGQFNVNNNYITPKPVIPSQPTKDGYSYPTPRPTFTVPPYQPQPSNTGSAILRPTTNEYLPPVVKPSPEPNLIGGESNTDGSFIQPPVYPQPNQQVINIANTHGSCAAALKCVQEIYCTAEGMISPTPVVLSKDQEFSRVPTTDCFDQQAGVAGKCCRDPNYVDPWPSANSLNGFDDGKYKEDPRLGQYFPQKPRIGRGGVKRQTEVTKCGLRHTQTIPRGQGLEVNFAEIPWQAMVLRDSNRSLLCGGVIIKSNVVLTSAHCVEGTPTHDILIKGGEWKLGIDEEPLPFQIVKVSAVIRHPQYVRGELKNDLALLILDENLRLAKNIAPICMPPPNQPPLAQCIATGWGKRVLQVHLRGAIMKSVDVNLLSPNHCEERLSKYNIKPHQYQPVYCGKSNNDQCDVDYGSALACTNGDGQYTLAGIFGWDTGCNDPEQIGGYIPLDVDWIESMSSKSLNEIKTLDKLYYQ
ncbi:hypothetical protein FQR65_LT13633 [Abscondita terminalis]|nr:hypothetical protein FQR65_LT13633 [Abscondita terminalis]